MVQSVNSKAILTLASVVRRPSLLVPHLSVPTVSQINYDALKRCAGIEAVIFDKDNTLTAPYGSSVHPDASEGLQRVLDVFGKERVAILSNSAGTVQDDPDFRDALQIEEAMGISVIRHKEKKPGGLEEVLQHFAVTDPAKLCMVGDRLLTDIVFGNIHGMLTVHTRPLCKGRDNARDNWTAKILRPIENKVLYGRLFGKALRRRRPRHKYWSGEVDCPLTIKDER
jgi:phosphatidylglycerophosphatase GEP4